MKLRFITHILFDKFYSLVFRLVLIIYALLIYFNNSNILYDLIYYLVFILYIIIYFHFINNNKSGSIIRLINDFSLITFFIFGKEFWDPQCLIFFLLPIFNFTNHTSSSVKWFPLVLVSIISFIILNLKIGFNLYNSIYLGSFFLVYSISFLRKKNELKPIQQFDDIEKSIHAFEHFPNTYLLYPKLISQIKSLKFTFCDFNNYETIICVELKENTKFRVLNASKVIYDFKVENFPFQFETESTLPYYNETLNVRLNGMQYPYSVVIKPNLNNNLLFIISSSVRPTSILQNRYLIEFLTPFLERFSRVIEYEQMYKLSRSKNLQEIKDKLFFIRKAEKAMHFIKNKLSPLDNLIAILNEQHIEKENVIYADEEVKTFILNELKKSDSNLEKIINTATIILNKENNPFTFSNLDKIKPVDIFWVIENLSMIFLMVSLL